MIGFNWFMKIEWFVFFNYGYNKSKVINVICVILKSLIRNELGWFMFKFFKKKKLFYKI